MLRSLQEAEARLEAADEASAERDLERIRELQSIYESTEVLLDAIAGLSPEELEEMFERFVRSIDNQDW